MARMAWLMRFGDCVREGTSSNQALTSNFSKWMMIQQSLVSLDGATCNRVGTSYGAFQTQPVRPGYICRYHEGWHANANVFVQLCGQQHLLLPVEKTNRLSITQVWCSGSIQVVGW